MIIVPVHNIELVWRISKDSCEESFLFLARKIKRREERLWRDLTGRAVGLSRERHPVHYEDFALCEKESPLWTLCRRLMWRPSIHLGRGWDSAFGHWSLNGKIFIRLKGLHDMWIVSMRRNPDEGIALVPLHHWFKLPPNWPSDGSCNVSDLTFTPCL